MSSELRPASEVWSIACGAYEDATADLLDLPMRDMVVAGDEAAADVIEADREAVRAEIARAIEVELSMCALANVEAPSEWIDGFEFAWKRVKEALLQYKEARDAS